METVSLLSVAVRFEQCNLPFNNGLGKKEACLVLEGSHQRSCLS